MIESVEEFSIPTPEDCDPAAHFVLDNGHSQTTVNLSIILQCLRFAELQGDIPSLPKEWWYPLINRHQIRMTLNENIQTESK